MSERSLCKGCGGSVRLTWEEIEAKYVKPLIYKKTGITPENTYAQRLEKCIGCDALEYGTTCKYCGCLVQVRAKILSSKCPYPYDPKW